MEASHTHNGQIPLILVHGVGPTTITFIDPAEDPRKSDPRDW